jgi:hypothetical protein
MVSGRQPPCGGGTSKRLEGESSETLSERTSCAGNSTAVLLSCWQMRNWQRVPL